MLCDQIESFGSYTVFVVPETFFDNFNSSFKLENLALQGLVIFFAFTMANLSEFSMYALVIRLYNIRLPRNEIRSLE